MKLPPNLPRIRALYALKKLSPQLNSDVLSDGNIAKRYEFDISRPIELADGTVMSQPELFKAFRQALLGQAVAPLHSQDGKPVSAEITIEEDGSAVVKTGERSFRFINAGLLLSDKTNRLGYLDAYIARNTLTAAHERQLRDLVSKEDFNDDDFLAATATLLTSPESFADALRRKVDTRSVSVAELLPEDERLWDHETASVVNSTSLAAFIDNELENERLYRLGGDPRKAIRLIALSFCAPGLVPIELFRTLSADAAREMLEEATTFSDHFALIGAFEICGDWLSRDASFGPLGEKLLDLLFADMQRLHDACSMYASAFIIAVAKLGQHHEWRKKPAFWRRLTAAAHASLVVRACGLSDINTKTLFGWAMSISGKAFYSTISLDMREEPRWGPDWIAPKFLVADAVGRADAALKRLPEEARNAEWKTRVDKARAWLETHNSVLLASYPAIGESSRRQQPLLKDLGELAALYQAFIDDPMTLDNFLVLGPATCSFGIPAECVPAATKLMTTLKRDAVKYEDVMVDSALWLAAYVAIQHQDVPLATAVADFYAQRLPTLKGDHSPTEAMFRIMECAAANPDESNAMKVLARRLENVAFVASPEHLAEVYDTLIVMQTMSSKLGQLLARAIAIARLGRGSNAA